jgi:hypothetical protein
MVLRATRNTNVIRFGKNGVTDTAVSGTLIAPVLGGTPSFTVGRRIDGYAPLNGRVYSLIIRGALSTTQEITDTETWVNGKTGAY